MSSFRLIAFRCRIALASVLWLGVSLSICLAQLPSIEPSEVGLSAERLERLSRYLQSVVDDNKAPGLVALIVRKGRVPYLQAFGKLDRETGAPMPKDAIFRIASQTKAVTTVAVMMLFEEGRFLLDDPISKYIPEFAGARVAVPSAEKGAKGYATVPVKRPITIRDLLTHTAGISYGYGPAREEYRAAGIQGWLLADQIRPVGEVVKKLATLPFDAQPGKEFVYGYNLDILGYLVEKISGMSLADFFAQKITGPLKMNDTHFFLPESKLGRFTSVYGLDEKGVLSRVEDVLHNVYVKGPRMCYSGGAGLLSTAADYGRFLQMLLNRGELDGVRLLSPKSIELMTADHVGGLYGSDGFGFGFWVTKKLGLDGQPGTVGSFGWGGAYHTTYWVDPEEQMVCVLMTQLMPATGSGLHGKFRALVYQAVIESYEK
jgi:CubicO group peptidase (beta-lactamase class C family)